MQQVQTTKPSFRIRVAAPGLDSEHFRPIALRGLGNGENSYAHSMAWFKGRLFVGTMRNSLCLLKRSGRALPPPKMAWWPVLTEDPMPPERMRAEIWRYDPAAGEWTRVHRSVMIERDGRVVMRDVGYRGMTVFRGANEREEALYVTSASGTGLRVLRSVDGETFEDVGPAGLGDPRLASCRSLIAWRDRLYATAVGTEGKNPNETERPVIFESDDPTRGRWREICLPGFGDPDNRAIAEMCVFNDWLYAGTLNPHSGFQIWKTRGEGEPPYDWRLVLSSGAYRGYLNEGTAALHVFGDALYVGTGIAGGGYNRYHKIGPGAAELLRLYPDDTWDIIAGVPRVTPQGSKLPLSGLGPGFNNALNGYLWRMTEHEGWLYAGTYNAGVWFPFIPVEIPEQYLKLSHCRDTEEFVERYAGCHLWRSQDGQQFIPVITDGFGTRYNFGIRQLVSTPHGLCVGTANPFGPKVGVKRDGEWSYETNPRGGVEVWLGRREYAGEPLAVTRSRATAVTEQREVASRIARVCTQWIYGALTEDFYGESGFTQMGLWREGTASAREACENLVEALIDLLEDRRGPLLEVGCGLGAATAVLARHWPAEAITGIDGLPSVLNEAQRRVPDATFCIMDPTHTEFPDGSFRSILCVEGPCYIETRRNFLREALRLLEPGGRLAVADLLYSRTGDATCPDRIRRNHLEDPKSYERLLQREGWKDVRVMDVTAECARTYHDQISRYLLRRFREGMLTEGDFNTLMGLVSRHLLFLRHYVLVSACKL
jgi:SAM-dependent methyltransferase